MLDLRGRIGIARPMMRMTPLFGLTLGLSLSACAPALPDLDSRLSAEARQAPFPRLEPFGALLDQADALRPGLAASAGGTLEARAADLRRRAAALNRMPL